MKLGSFAHAISRLRDVAALDAELRARLILIANAHTTPHVDEPPERAPAVAFGRLYGCAFECVLAVVCSDTRILSVSEVARGGPVGVDLPVAAVMHALWAHGGAPSRLLLAHNHPRADATPSPEDVAAIAYFRTLLTPAGIRVAGLVIGHDGSSAMIDP